MRAWLSLENIQRVLDILFKFAGIGALFVAWNLLDTRPDIDTSTQWVDNLVDLPAMSDAGVLPESTAFADIVEASNDFYLAFLNSSLFPTPSMADVRVELMSLGSRAETRIYEVQVGDELLQGFDQVAKALCSVGKQVIVELFQQDPCSVEARASGVETPLYANGLLLSEQLRQEIGGNNEESAVSDMLRLVHDYRYSTLTVLVVNDGDGVARDLDVYSPRGISFTPLTREPESVPAGGFVEVPYRTDIGRSLEGYLPIEIADATAAEPQLIRWLPLVLVMIAGVVVAVIAVILDLRRVRANDDHR